MVNCETVRKRLNEIYGNSIICGIGRSIRMEYGFSGRKNYAEAEIVVYIHEEYRIAIVWNLAAKRKQKPDIRNLSLSTKWSEYILEMDKIRAEYRRREVGKPYEKILVLSVDALYSIREQLYEHLQVNPSDVEFPRDLDVNDTDTYDILSERIRERVSTSRWERGREFRKRILKLYAYKCAICGCVEEELLQAAHIKAVADGGSDDVENGICLCANHHIMFDRELIKINLENKTFSYVDENIKDMAWLNKFDKMYSGTILKKK